MTQRRYRYDAHHARQLRLAAQCREIFAIAKRSPSDLNDWKVADARLRHRQHIETAKHARGAMQMERQIWDM